MDEDYLVGLQKQVKQEELQVRKLQEYKEKLQKDINSLRNEKEEGERDSKIFVKEQLDDITKEIGTARKYAEEEIERSMSKIKQINEIARALKEQGETIDKKRVQIETDILVLEKDKEDTQNNIRKANEYLEAAKQSVTKANIRRFKTVENEKLIKKILDNASLILNNIENYRKNVGEKLQKKKNILEEKQKILDGGYAALGAGMKWVETEKIKIKDEWISLMKAKEYLNKKNGS